MAIVGLTVAAGAWVARSDVAPPAAAVPAPAATTEIEPPGLAAAPRDGAGLASRKQGSETRRLEAGGTDPDAPFVDEVTDVCRSTWALVDGADGRPLTRREEGAGEPLWFMSTSGGATTYTVILPTEGEYEAEERGAAAVDVRHPRGATRLHFQWPLYRTRSLDVRVVDADGVPVQGAELQLAGPAAGFRARTVETAADGTARLARVIELGADRVWVEVFVGRDPSTGRFAAKYRVPIEPGESVGAEPAVVRLLGERRVEAERSDATAGAATEARFGTVRVRAVLADGRPAARVAVGIDGGGVSPWMSRDPSSGGGRRTDGDGRAELVAIAGIPVRVSLMDHDVTPTTVVVTLAADEILDVTLVEPAPAALDVEVVDARGAPVPFARLAVHTPSEVPPWDIVDGVVRLDPFTGPDGRRCYTCVEPGTVEVEATFGGRRGVATVALTAGTRASVRVRLGNPSTTFPSWYLHPSER